MNTWAKWIFPLMVVLTAALIGFELGRQLAGNAATSARSDLLRSERERIAAGTLNRKLMVDNASLENALAEPEPAVAVVPELGPGLETIGRLKQLQQMKAGVILIAVQRGKIYSGFAQLFGLTDAEVARLNDAIRQAHTEIKEPTVSATNLSILNGALVVQVPPSEDGSRQRQKLLDEFAAAIGPERFAALIAMSGAESIDSEFNAFGAVARQITITRNRPGQFGGPGFTLSDGRRNTTGGSGASIVQFTDPNQLPEKYQWLSPIIPSLADLQPPTGPVRLVPPVEKK